MQQTINEFPFWTSVNEIPTSYPWMTQDECCDVAVIGGGLSGAMCAYRMAQEGIDRFWRGIPFTGTDDL